VNKILLLVLFNVVKEKEKCKIRCMSLLEGTIEMNRRMLNNSLFLQFSEEEKGMTLKLLLINLIKK
jgi:hypothetical protein